MANNNNIKKSWTNRTKGKKKELWRCVICDSENCRTVSNGYDISCTVLVHGGVLLSENINKVLDGNVDITTNGNSLICKRCFELFQELDEAEYRCLEIRKEINGYYVKTYEKQDCSKETAITEEVIEENIECKPDIKLKIAVNSKRRGRPRKFNQELPSKKKKSSETKIEKLTDGEIVDTDKNIQGEDTLSNEAEECNTESVEDYDTCDTKDDEDDFEWKDTEDSAADDNAFNSSSDSPNENSDGNKQKRSSKRKKKRTDRKGERAFMPPIHECSQCGKKWRTVTELKSHIASHSAIRPYVCEICGQAYKMKKALDIHIGMHNGIHPFVCSYCNKSFTQKVGLEKHLPIHTGVTRFQCDLCGKRFIHQKSFNIHKMTHTGEKNIHCPICNLAVFSRSHLKRHYRVHTGERPYGCGICGKKFAEKYNLNAHIRIHDPNTGGDTSRRKPHACPICGMTYERKHKMADHLSTAHCIWTTGQQFKQDPCYFNQQQEQQSMTPVQVQTQQPPQHLMQLHPRPEHQLHTIPVTGNSNVNQMMIPNNTPPPLQPISSVFQVVTNPTNTNNDSRHRNTLLNNNNTPTVQTAVSL